MRAILDRTHDRVRSILGTKKGGDWGNLPSQGEVMLAAAEWTKMLPPDTITVPVAAQPEKPTIMFVAVTVPAATVNVPLADG